MPGTESLLDLLLAAPGQRSGVPDPFIHYSTTCLRRRDPTVLCSKATQREASFRSPSLLAQPPGTTRQARKHEQRYQEGGRIVSVFVLSSSVTASARLNVTLVRRLSMSRKCWHPPFFSTLASNYRQQLAINRRRWPIGDPIAPWLATPSSDPHHLNPR